MLIPLLVKGIFIKFLQLVLELHAVKGRRVYLISLFVHDLRVFGVFIEFAEPFDLFSSLLSSCLLDTHSPVIMEFLRLLGRIDLNLIERGQNFVTDGTPSVVFIPAIPPVFIAVVLWLVELDIDAGFTFILF